MSFQKFSQVLPKQINDRTVAAMVANSLREEHRTATSVAKEIGMITGANLHTINKWCQAVNAPKSAHLLMLAAAYPQVLKSILEMIGRGDVWELCLAENIPGRMRPTSGGIQHEKRVYRDKFVPINVIVDVEAAVKMNQRQLWFVGELQHGKKPKAEDIANQWWVTEKTARRDISSLVEYGVIRFNGARKNGFYTVT